MSRINPTCRPKRWKRLLICVCLLLLLIGGIERWNAYRAASPFYGRWRLLDANGLDPKMPVAHFKTDGRAILPWFGAEYPVMNHDLRWSVTAGELVVEPYIEPRLSFWSWVNRYRHNENDIERLEIIEVSANKIRLRLKAKKRDPAGPESVYVRLDDR